MVNCPNCGEDIADEARFCGFCGTQLTILGHTKTVYGVGDDARAIAAANALSQPFSSRPLSREALRPLPPPSGEFARLSQSLPPDDLALSSANRRPDEPGPDLAQVFDDFLNDDEQSDDVENADVFSHGFFKADTDLGPIAPDQDPRGPTSPATEAFLEDLLAEDLPEDLFAGRTLGAPQPIEQMPAPAPAPEPPPAAVEDAAPMPVDRDVEERFFGASLSRYDLEGVDLNALDIEVGELEPIEALTNPSASTPAPLPEPEDSIEQVDRDVEERFFGASLSSYELGSVDADDLGLNLLEDARPPRRRSNARLIFLLLLLALSIAGGVYLTMFI